MKCKNPNSRCQVGSDIEIKVAAVVKVATPNILHWRSAQIGFALREVLDASKKDDRKFNEFQTVEVKTAFRGKSDLRLFLEYLYFVVENVKFPEAGLFRTEVRVQVVKGENISKLVGPEKRPLGPKWQEDLGELQEIHLAGMAVASQETEVKGAEISPCKQSLGSGIIQTLAAIPVHGETALTYDHGN